METCTLLNEILVHPKYLGKELPDMTRSDNFLQRWHDTFSDIITYTTDMLALIAVVQLGTL